jgi:hypothetical protein
MANQNGPPGRTANPRQFSLWGLMVFVTVFSVWCSQIAVASQRAEVRDTPRNGITWLLSIFLAWGVLSLFYYRHRLWGPFTFQSWFPWTLSALLLPTSGWQSFSQWVLLMNLICFPWAVLVMALRWSACPTTTAATETLAKMESPDEASEEPRPGADQHGPPGEAGP